MLVRAYVGARVCDAIFARTWPGKIRGEQHRGGNPTARVASAGDLALVVLHSIELIPSIFAFRWIASKQYYSLVAIALHTDT